MTSNPIITEPLPKPPPCSHAGCARTVSYTYRSVPVFDATCSDHRHPPLELIAPAVAPSGPRIIALGHQSRVGKDTAARAMEAAIATHHLRARVYSGLRVQRFAFANVLKGVAHEMFGHLGLKRAEFYETAEGAALRDVQLCGGCPPPKEGKTQPCPGKFHLTPVATWIHLGQKMRDIYPSVWADYLLGEIQQWKGDVAIITDLRFTNEGELVRAAGGVCIKVVRPDAPPPKGSDDMIARGFPWNATLVNDGSIELLQDRAGTLARKALEAWGLA